MEVKINIVEAAARLAEKRLSEFFKNKYKNTLFENEIDQMIHEQVSENEMGYTDEAQEIFNEYYDEIFNTLEDCKTDIDD